MSYQSKIYFFCASITVAALAGCSHQKGATSTDPVSTEPIKTASVQLPEIPDKAAPHSGAVTEFWVNGQIKAEKVYDEGEIKSATYFASDGTLIYEMFTH